MLIISKFAPFILFLIMLGVGFSIKVKDFIEVFKDFKVLLIGLLSQMVILPVIGLLFAIFAPIDIVLRIGIVLITCVPSAVTSNYITKLANGNVALSVSLTAITACLSFISIPFILKIVLPFFVDEIKTFQEINFIKISLGLLLITTIPVFLGAYMNMKFSIFVEKINKSYSIFSLLLFLLVIFTAWYSEWNVVISLYKSIGFWALSLAGGVLVTSYTLVNLVNLNEANKKTIIIESFIQNAAMAIIVGGAILGSENGYLAIAALYALLQYKILLILWATNKFLN